MKVETKTLRFGRKVFRIEGHDKSWSVWRLYASGKMKLLIKAKSEQQAMADVADAAADEIVS